MHEKFRLIFHSLENVRVNAARLLAFMVRAACLQNETAPEKLLNQYEKRFEKREKKIRKTIRNAFETFLAPLRPLKNISPALFTEILKSFHRPKFAQKKSVFSPRGSAGVATLIYGFGVVLGPLNNDSHSKSQFSVPFLRQDITAG